ncbi:MAG: DUF1801 domain-containing protein [Planctomycetota bacterium]|nr:DUF1801 domain-containing protein [Planctomycetota bacterium]
MAKIVTVSKQGTFQDAITSFEPEIQSIAKALRELMATTLPGVTEVPWVKQKIVGYGVGPKKMSEHFCYIAPFKKHVNLGFFYGADLDDPQSILEGSGKSLRHIKVKTMTQVKDAPLTSLVKAASKHLPKLKT